MAKKISELPVVNAVQETDSVLINHSGTTSTIPVEDLLPQIDDEPVEGSSNPVASGGVFEALKSAGGIPDWTQEDPSKTDYIRNRPFYRTVSSSSSICNLSGSSLAVSSYGSDYAYTNYYSISSLMTIGKEYRVTVTNGKHSITEDIVAKSYSSTYLRLTGNAFFIEQNKTSYKVRVGLNRSVFNDSGGNVSLTIKLNTYSYTKLPKEYLDTSFAAPEFADSDYVAGSSPNYSDAYVLMYRGGSYYRCLFADAFSNRLSASGLSADINDLYESLDSLASTVTSQNNALKKRVSALETKQGEYEEEIADLQEQIRTLQSRVAYLESLHADGDVIVTEADSVLSFDGTGASVVDGELVLNSPTVFMVDGVLVYGSETADSGMVMEGDNLSLNGAMVEDGILTIDSGQIVVEDGTVTSGTAQTASVSEGDLTVTGVTVNSTGDVELSRNATIEDGVLAIS